MAVAIFLTAVSPFCETLCNILKSMRNCTADRTRHSWECAILLAGSLFSYASQLEQVCGRTACAAGSDNLTCACLDVVLSRPAFCIDL